MCVCCLFATRLLQRVGAAFFYRVLLRCNMYRITAHLRTGRGSVLRVRRFFALRRTFAAQPFFAIFHRALSRRISLRAAAAYAYAISLRIRLCAPAISRRAITRCCICLLRALPCARIWREAAAA